MSNGQILPPARRPTPEAATWRGMAVANAPVSYGAFEITVGVDPNVPDPLTLLDWVSEAGYVGIDLGPVGYLGDTRDAAGRLADRGLGLAGGYLELPFSEPAKLTRRCPSWRRCWTSSTASRDGAARRSRLSPTPAPRFDHATRGGRRLDPSVGLDDAGWERFADGLARAVERCRERGYDPTFHHHTATYIEAHWEIERLLEICATSGCAWTPATCCSAGVTRSRRSASGRSASTKCTSRTPACAA